MTLLDRLTHDHGYPILDATLLDAFATENPHSLLLFAGDPARYPEALDLAVILPELVRHYAGRLTPAVIAPAAEQALAVRFALTHWPSLVVLRGGAHLGTIGRVRDWGVYLSELDRLLGDDAHLPPSTGGG